MRRGACEALSLPLIFLKRKRLRKFPDKAVLRLQVGKMCGILLYTLKEARIHSSLFFRFRI